MKWTPISQDLPEHDVIVETRIDDADGCRNEQCLRRRGNLWFMPDNSMYVYYRPTHWRPATPAQVDAIKAHAIKAAEAQLDAAKNL